MIGTALKKYALENEMTVDKGFAYGSLKGYYACMFDGMGTKSVCFFTSVPGEAEAVSKAVADRNIEKEFRVQQLGIGNNTIYIDFKDNPGTMKRLRAFVDLFARILDSLGASRDFRCWECGELILGNGGWKILDNYPVPLHDSCAGEILRNIEEELNEQKMQDMGSYSMGALGALLGAIVGAAVWAGVLYIGYVTSIVGLLICFLAVKGYELFKGKNDKGKIIIIIAACFIGIVLGTLAGDFIAFASLISNEEVVGYTYSDILPLIFELLAEDSEFLLETVKSIGIGVLFAGLGAWAFIYQIKKQVSPKMKISNLK